MSLRLRQVARGAEDDDRARVAACAAARRPFEQRVRLGSWLGHSALHRVAAELVAQRRVTFAANDSSWREAKRAKSEAVIDRRGHVLGDRLVDRPAALAGVVDVALEVRQLAAVLVERAFEQLEQPERTTVP